MSQQKHIQRWKKAVVHLECATDSEHFSDFVNRIETIVEEMDARGMSKNELNRQLGGKFRDLRFHGTAIFFKHNNRRYLLTVRHVLWDKVAANREWRNHHGDTITGGEPDPNRIFDIIFRVPTLDEVVADNGREERKFLMNLRLGTAYSFSDPELDLAVISLDRRDKLFADELERFGYEPVGIRDIADAPSSEGEEVFAVGYPSATALLGQLSYNRERRNWASNYFSLPTFTFGRVAMLHPSLAYFWCDMSIYPGNSGSPVIENGKLVGIVKEQATVPIDQDGSTRLMSRIPFGKVVKALYLKDLIEQQIDKD